MQLNGNAVVYGHPLIFLAGYVARIIYGNTWWGKQWLHVLAHIDYDNRLPRGRTYAGKGAVRDLTLQGGTVQANVLGSRSPPYRVFIQVPPLPREQVDQLLDALVTDPGVIARLLNRELDPAVSELARRLGIAVFPSRWKDLVMKCSCPDWAVPCKHLAAVIYVISREIDSNPFLVFTLRGVDLIQQLKTRGINIAHEAKADVPGLSALLTDDGITDGEVQSDLCRFFIAVQETHPITQKVHFILDGAGYHRAELVQDWAVVMNIYSTGCRHTAPILTR